MKTKMFTLFLLSGLVYAFTPVHIDELKVDVQNSKLEWFATKVTGAHNGIAPLKNGVLKMDHGVLTGGSFTIDMSKIESTDMEGEYKEKLDGHLKSEDFFNVEQFPTAMLKISKAEKKADNLYTITADLTIRGITNSISFPANVVAKEGKFSANAEIKIDRTKWDIKYGSGSFFDDLGDKMIYDEITFKVNIATVIAKS